MYDYSKLAGAITEKYRTQRNFAIAMGLSERTISLKMSGKIDWKQAEIEKATALLQISDSQIPAYFFKKQVQY